ncbi:hypothetical protein E2C01_050474 [Portunus trituberculatus]|uniref:Uncharacterized protein n=1 Tax=Portunus trituberculatus TaxID=210409 RepID=A0A5B7GGL1_PORTR|nr:hypothetical protein [Portunus trituberculatus]
MGMSVRQQARPASTTVRGVEFVHAWLPVGQQGGGVRDHSCSCCGRRLPPSLPIKTASCESFISRNLKVPAAYPRRSSSSTLREMAAAGVVVVEKNA